MTTMFFDAETYCDTPISHGTHRYAEQVEITVGAFTLDDKATVTRDLTAAPEAREEIIENFEKADEIVIHNSSFDRTAIRHAWGYEIPAEKIRDTMVTAMAHSLPGSLGKLCEILNIPTDQAKDKRGRSLIQLFCKPRPAKHKLRRATRETHPQEWQEFLDYARLDIEAMRAIDKKLPKWNLTQAERELWLLDQRINDRGVAIDMALVDAAITAVDRAQEGLSDDAQRLTDGAVRAATQRDAMLRFILESHGVPMDDLRASTIEAMLNNDNYPPELLDLLRVRLRASTSSTAKYNALAKSTSSDGRLRGTLQFCGAGRTGRWSGRLFQPQNLPRPSLDNAAIEAGVAALKADCADLVVENVMELASSAIRGCIVAPPGMKLVVADLSNIEGRVLAWLAGEQWKLKAFAAYDAGEGADLYKLAYARTFRVPVADVTKDQRQVGKVLELAMGYEGGVGAFITFALAYGIDLDDLAARARPSLGAGLISEAEGMLEWMQKQDRGTQGLSEETWVVIDAIKRGWRHAHPATTDLWKALKEAATGALQNPGREVRVGAMTIVKTQAWLRIILPSGRSLCYPGARVDDDGSISYMGVNQYSRRWERLKTYGGKLAENVTQAVARDVLAAGMLAAEREAYRIVLSVHDELITEAPDDEGYHPHTLAALMSIAPPWAKGLPLAAAGFETHRYRKD